MKKFAVMFLVFCSAHFYCDGMNRRIDSALVSSLKFDSLRARSLDNCESTEDELGENNYSTKHVVGSESIFCCDSGFDFLFVPLRWIEGRFSFVKNRVLIKLARKRVESNHKKMLNRTLSFFDSIKCGNHDEDIKVRERLLFHIQRRESLMEKLRSLEKDAEEKELKLRTEILYCRVVIDVLERKRENFVKSRKFETEKDFLESNTLVGRYYDIVESAKQEVKKILGSVDGDTDLLDPEEVERLDVLSFDIDHFRRAIGILEDNRRKTIKKLISRND